MQLGILPPEPRFSQLALGFEERIGSRGQVAMDSLQVANDIDMYCARLKRLRPATSQADEMVLRSVALGRAHRALVGE
jgi:hypothetical protein